MLRFREVPKEGKIRYTKKSNPQRAASIPFETWPQKRSRLGSFVTKVDFFGGKGGLQCCAYAASSSTSKPDKGSDVKNQSFSALVPFEDSSYQEYHVRLAHCPPSI